MSIPNAGLRGGSRGLAMSLVADSGGILILLALTAV
jgi:hypothetical protein